MVFRHHSIYEGKEKTSSKDIISFLTKCHGLWRVCRNLAIIVCRIYSCRRYVLWKEVGVDLEIFVKFYEWFERGQGLFDREVKFHLKM